MSTAAKTRRKAKPKDASIEQVNALKTYSADILVMYRKLGGKYEQYSEADLHRMIYTRKKSDSLHSCWDGYKFHEAQLAISFFKVHIKPWLVKKLKEREEQRATQLESIKRECFGWTQMWEWMKANHPNFHPACYFEHAATDGKFTYWRLREKPVAFLTLSQAQAEYRSIGLDKQGYSFEQCFAKETPYGWQKVFYKRLFETGAAI